MKERTRTRGWLAAGVALVGLAGLGLGPIGACSGFVAHLSGGELAPEPAVETEAQGQATLMYTEVTPPSESIPDGVPGGGPLAGREPAQLDFKLRVSDTADVAGSGDDGQLLAARIHCAAGDVAVTLFEAMGGGGVVTPTGVNGAITDAHASFGDDNPCGLTSVAELVDLLETGEAYVQVETNAHPEGEIRGPIREVGRG